MRSLASRWTSRFPDERFIFISGFHHSGTTLVQEVLRQQGAFMFVDERDDGEPGRPQETHLRELHRLRREALQGGHTWAAMKFPSNTREGVGRLARELPLLAPRCTLVLCYRDPAATVLSLAGRHGWDPDRAWRDAAAQQAVAVAWQDYTDRHRGRVVRLALEDFTADPESYVRAILGLPMDQVLPATINARKRYERDEMPSIPDSGNHADRRRIQTQLPIYPVDRNDWQGTAADAVVVDVLHAIRERYGTSPAFPPVN
ncbi:MAG: sulfotransferase [Acidobacteria bacterium]|nr:sulfotransferase [Acidobacteriota bacterium]